MVCSPLRYMGGKRWLAPHIKRLLPAHEDYIEAFCGGAAIAINIAGRVRGKNSPERHAIRPDALLEGLLTLPYRRIESKVRSLSGLGGARGGGEIP